MIDLLTALLITVTPVAHAQSVYKCTGPDGRVTFSQAPCAIDAETYDVTVDRPRDEDAEAARSRVDSIDLERQRRAHDLRIDEARRRLTKLEVARDDELDALRQQQARAANNLAGATWLQSIATEMQVVTLRYDSQIDEVRREIEQLEATRP